VLKDKAGFEPPSAGETIVLQGQLLENGVLQAGRKLKTLVEGQSS